MDITHLWSLFLTLLFTTTHFNTIMLVPINPEYSLDIFINTRLSNSLPTQNTGPHRKSWSSPCLSFSSQKGASPSSLVSSSPSFPPSGAWTIPKNHHSSQPCTSGQPLGLCFKLLPINMGGTRSWPYPDSSRWYPISGPASLLATSCS